MNITVVVPTKNRPGLLIQCLNGLYCQSSRGFDVIVCDDNSDYDVAALVRAHPLGRLTDVTVIRNPGTGAGSARDCAAAKASGDVLALLDDDAVPDEHWIAVIEREMSSSTEKAITGRILPLQTSLLSRCRQSRYEARQRAAVATRDVDFMAGGNSAIGRSTFLELGGFDAKFLMMHDAELSQRMKARGIPCLYVADLVIHHMHVKTAIEPFQNAFNSGRFRWALAKNYPDRKLRPLREWNSIVANIAGSASEDPLDVRVMNSFLHCIHLLGHARAQISGML